ncbi:MAG: DUF929 domain-containing protein [Candidatus Marsarchaeota archaeon]|nr:DUF929 domain-containing protein [Candidatus Marsarchaeota archaeon]
MKKQKLTYGTTNKLLIAAIAVGIVAIVMSSYAILNPQVRIVYRNVTANASTVQGYNITGSLLEPPTSFPDAPVITQNQSFGSRLTNINAQFNASELAVINNAPNSYFEQAGEMLLNGTLNNTVGTATKKLPIFSVNGKPTVLYLGSITCIFCGENRWAMAMALSRFGSFSHLFKGYSSLGDGDMPTLYWAPAHYNSSSTVFGNFYQSNLINFVSIEDANPISGGFSLNPMSLIQQRVNQTKNTVYTDALSYLISTNDFSGTPFTVWGSYEVGGADAVIFGNNTNKEGTAPLQHMTHQDVLSQFAQSNDQFALSEYAAADVYVALMCKTLNNTPSVCTAIPSIQAIETKMGL